MILLDKITKQNKKVFCSNGKVVKINSIMIDDNGVISSFFCKTDELHELRSISKVLIALAYGIAIKKQMYVYAQPITINTPVYPILKDSTNISEENKEKIKEWTIKTLLTYTAGYGEQMFSKEFIKEINPKDYLNYVLNYKMPNNPNTKYVYNNAETFILSVFFKEVFDENIKDFIVKEIFTPLQITNFKWENYDKYCAGCTGLYLSHKDMFKIGELILHKGKYNSRQIISEDYIEEMCSSQINTPYAIKDESVLPKKAVGYVMHISHNGYIYKDGANGQYLIINFEKNQLITILSKEKEMNKVAEILKLII